MARSGNINPYKLVERLSCLNLPEEGGSIQSSDDLLIALVNGSDKRGRYFASPWLLKGLFWWDNIDINLVRQWRDDLVARDEISIKPIGRSVYGDSVVNIAVIQNPRRFDRFAPRSAIPSEVRQSVYKRDGYKCLWCNADNCLSVDHIIPVSKGGSDDEDNLQTLCRSCNSRKHNTDDDVARERFMGVGA